LKPGDSTRSRWIGCLPGQATFLGGTRTTSANKMREPSGGQNQHTVPCRYQTEGYRIHTIHNIIQSILTHRMRAVRAYLEHAPELAYMPNARTCILVMAKRDHRSWHSSLVSRARFRLLLCRAARRLHVCCMPHPPAPDPFYWHLK